MFETAFPKMTLVQQFFNRERVKDIPVEVVRETEELVKVIKKGSRVAVACGSRGIANYDLIVKSLILQLKKTGAEVFIIPAMGSHGGATAEGQQNVLAHLGITEQSMGVPVLSCMQTVRIGETHHGIPVSVDKNAFEADYIVPVNRVKKHTEFYGEIESGLMKMLAIGLAKERADFYHNAMFNFGYSDVILSVGRKILETGKIPFGIAVIDNAYAETMRVCGVPGEKFEEKEKELLKIAKDADPKLPFQEADILIIDEIGKEISGTGFDTKVVGRIGLPLLAQEINSPAVKRLVICDLTEKTEGNAIGVGVADFVTQRLVDKIDRQSLYINSITGATPEYAKIPLTAQNDREALQLAIQCVGIIPTEKLKIMRIKNTLCLEHLYASEAYAGEVAGGRDRIGMLSEKEEIRFDQDGNFLPIEP